MCFALFKCALSSIRCFWRLFCASLYRNEYWDVSWMCTSYGDGHFLLQFVEWFSASCSVNGRQRNPGIQVVCGFAVKQVHAKKNNVYSTHPLEAVQDTVVYLPSASLFSKVQQQGHWKTRCKLNTMCYLSVSAVKSLLLLVHWIWSYINNKAHTYARKGVYSRQSS